MSREREKVAEAETVRNVEGNMSGAAMRGVGALPWSETLSRTKRTRRNLGDFISPAAAQAVTGHGGKSKRRSRWGRGEESDGCVVPVKPRTKPILKVGGGDGGGKAAGRREGKQQRMPRTQSRIRHGTEAASLRIGGAWAAQAPNFDLV